MLRLWRYNSYTALYLISFIALTFLLVFMFLNSYSYVGFTSYWYMGKRDIETYCKLGILAFLICLGVALKSFIDGVRQFSLRTFCQAWIHNNETGETIQKYLEYLDIDKTSIIVYTPNKEGLEFLKNKLDEQKTAEQGKTENKDELARKRELLERALKILKEIKPLKRKEPYYLVFTDKLIILASEFFEVYTNRLAGLGYERVFIGSALDYNKEAKILISNTVIPKMKLKEAFLLRDIVIGLVKALEQIANSTANESVAVITEIVKQLKRSMAEGEISKDIAKPRRTFAWSPETPVGKRQWSPLATKLITIFAVGLIIIGIVVVLVLAF